MERSTIWSLSSPGGQLFGSPRITFITRSEAGCAAASPSPAAAPTPPNVIEPVAPYMTLPSVDDPDGVLYDYAAVASTPPPPDAVEVLFPNTDALVGDRIVFDPMGAGREMPLHRVDVDLTGYYPLWTADDTSSCDDCPVRSYSDQAWRDQGDEREAGR